MGDESLLEYEIHFRFGREKSIGSRCSRPRPGQSFLRCLLLVGGRQISRFRRGAGPELQFHKFGGGAEVYVSDAAPAEQALLDSELLDRLLGPALSNMHLAQCGMGPDFTEQKTEIARDGQRFLGVVSARSLLALPGLEPSEPPERGRQIGALPGLASEGYDLVEACLGIRPSLPCGVVDCQVEEEMKERAQSS